MSDDILKDPDFRSQYERNPRPDPEFEQALGDGARVLRMSIVSQPLTPANIQPWLAPLHK